MENGGVNMKKYGSFLFRFFLPFLAILLSVLVYYQIPDNGKQKATDHPYYLYFIYLIGAVVLVEILLGFFFNKVRERVYEKAPLITGALVFMAFLNFVTTKTLWLPILYFPSLDRIVGLLVEQRMFLLENILSSFRLLIVGFLYGAIVGFLTGLALGYYKIVGYWLNPVTKIVGPIPTTAWIPLALSIFPSTYGANVFLIAFAVWFPVTLMTSSGIQSISNVNFEVARTLGASTRYQILHIAIPAAMPSIFLGVFYGTVSSFATLMAVEMNGNSSGIGWYICWQKSVMMYDGVYAGLILIALICSLTLTILFRVRDRVLVWQKGVIKW